jgi:hypothetical protein
MINIEEEAKLYECMTFAGEAMPRLAFTKFNNNTYYYPRFVEYLMEKFNNKDSSDQCKVENALKSFLQFGIRSHEITWWYLKKVTECNPQKWSKLKSILDEYKPEALTPTDVRHIFEKNPDIFKLENTMTKGAPTTFEEVYKNDLEELRTVVPETYGDLVQKYPELREKCLGHEYDNRTTIENAIWLIKMFAELKSIGENSSESFFKQLRAAAAQRIFTGTTYEQYMSFVRRQKEGGTFHHVLGSYMGMKSTDLFGICLMPQTHSETQDDKQLNIERMIEAIQNNWRYIQYLLSRKRN